MIHKSKHHLTISDMIFCLWISNQRVALWGTIHCTMGRCWYHWSVLDDLLEIFNEILRWDIHPPKKDTSDIAVLFMKQRTSVCAYSLTIYRSERTASLVTLLSRRLRSWRQHCHFKRNTHTRIVYQGTHCRVIPPRCRVRHNKHTQTIISEPL